MRHYSRNEARTFRPNEIRLRWHNLQKNNDQLKQSVIQKTLEISADPTAFFEQIVGFKPYAYQKEFIEMFQNNQFTAARWCRQSGKTYIIAALLLWYATTHPQSSVGIVGPALAPNQTNHPPHRHLHTQPATRHRLQTPAHTDSFRKRKQHRSLPKQPRNHQRPNTKRRLL